jgi:uncharacterized damage-inducible protein DinB
MTQLQAWFDRRFEFLFPEELFPNLCARLRGAPSRLEEVTRAGVRELLVRRPADKTWSAQEHAGHLVDLESLWIARVGDYLAGSTMLTAADLTNRKTHQANHNERALEEILSEFRSARSELLQRVNAVDPILFSRSIPHPRLQKPMRLVDHLYFVAEHDDHHLARIWELLKLD